MEPKNRQVIVVAIIILIAIAMFASFGRSLFALRTPQVVLPSTGVTDSSADSSQGSGQYQQVAVTPKTAPSVVATLARPESYYRELTIETFWEGGSSSAQVQVWKDGGWSHSRQTLPSGVIRHDLTDGETLYYLSLIHISGDGVVVHSPAVLGDVHRPHPVGQRADHRGSEQGHQGGCHQGGGGHADDRQLNGHKHILFCL